nr:MAG TPA: anaerobic ribonucleoside triphosphate reductase [Caudoviricetes sp.]
MKVLKRDKTVEDFKLSKIEKAIKSAFDSCGVTPNDDILDCIKKIYDESKDETIGVEDIQDNVERCLMASYPDVAKAYIIYRYQHKLIRENQSKLTKQIKKKLTAEDVQNQNANVDEFSFGGRVGEASRVVTKQYALDYCMSRKARNNHMNNEIYIHDLDSYAIGEHNCLTIPFDELLSKGFKTRQTDIRPANSINTAFQLIAVLFQIQSLQQFGGVAAGHIDWTIVPYVRKSFYKHFTKKYALSEMKKEGKYITDSKELSEYRKAKRKEFNEKYDIKDEKFTIGDFSMDCVNFHVGDEKIININKDWYEEAYIETMEELMQAIEGMYHNLNSLQSRSGNQLPFTSINYGTCTLPEGRMVIKALLEGSMKGVGEHHLTPIFPCGIFQCMKGVNRKEGEPNYDLFKIALKSTSQRIYPNYCNVDWSNNKGYDVNNPRTYNATMGCHAKDTPIVMADGSRKMVQDIKVGDKLMGVNGQTRVVESLIRGNDKLFKVNQSKAKSYIVNEGHVLSLIYIGEETYKNIEYGMTVNITVHDFMNLNEEMKSKFNGYKEDGTLSNITITEDEVDDFYGFELDGDRLYVMDDGTVTHNCRTYNGYDINGFGQLKDGRGNLAPVTIIMPTLAMEVKQSFGEKEYTKDEFVAKFLKLLDKKIFESKDMLLERFERMCKQSPKAATFMWENGSMFGYNEKEGPISALRHGTLVIGQLGLAETLQILIGTDHTTEEGMTLAKEIEGLFKKRCSEFKDETHLNFGVYYTPAENLCYTSFKKFKEQYGDIEGVTYFLKKDDKGNEVRKDKEYFTNSIHVPVYKEMSPFEKIDIESQLTCFSNAGCITYVELPSGTNNNIEGLETIVNYAMDKDIPYFAINVPIDECHDCGFTGEIGEVCPECGSRNVEHLRRCTGYLSTTYEHFNLGKQDETKDRVKHINKI